MTPVVSFARQRQSWLSYTVTAQGTYGGEAEPKRVKKYARVFKLYEKIIIPYLQSSRSD